MITAEWELRHFCFFLSSCDMITQEHSSNDDQMDNISPLIINQIPFPGKDQSGSILKNNEGGEKYVVNYSTLNTADKLQPYTYDRFEIFFPDEILASAAGGTRTLKVSFTIASGDVRTDSRSNENGDSIVRTANMIIPDSDQAQQMVLDFIKVFNPISGVHELLVENGLINEDDGIIPASGGCNVIDLGLEFCIYLEEFNDWLCSPYLIWEQEAFVEFDGDASPRGDDDDDNEGGDEGGGGGSGGSPPDGDEDDPCEHYGDDEGDENGNPGDGHDEEGLAPRMIECNECNFPNPPAWCAEEEEELTCDNVDELISMLTGQGIISALEQESGFNNPDHGLRNELLKYTFVDDEGNITQHSQ